MAFRILWFTSLGMGRDGPARELQGYDDMYIYKDTWTGGIGARGNGFGAYTTL